jgi:hypothetical protein
MESVKLLFIVLHGRLSFGLILAIFGAGGITMFASLLR